MLEAAKIKQPDGSWYEPVGWEGPLLASATSFASMFSKAPWNTVTSAPDLDTSKVTDMGSMFIGCSSLTSVPEYDTSKVTDMNSMFDGCSSLTSVPEYDTSNVTDMYAMFNGCSSLTSLSLNASNVTNMGSMFRGCSSLTSLKMTSLAVGVDLTGTNLDGPALNEFFRSIGSPRNSWDNTIKLGSIPGASTCDPSIATAKGWVVSN